MHIGPPTMAFVGGINSVIEGGQLKEDAPPAQLYNLEKDVNQATNLYHQYPEIVKDMEAILKAYITKNNQNYEAT